MNKSRKLLLPFSFRKSFLNIFRAVVKIKNFNFCGIETLSNIYLFQPSFAFHTETSHLFCSANKMTGFYMKSNSGLQWVNNMCHNISQKKTLHFTENIEGNIQRYTENIKRQKIPKM